MASKKGEPPHGRKGPRPRTIGRSRGITETLERRLLFSRVFYVDANATGATHDGTAWASAYADLQQALTAAASGDSIHVAKGTYKPTATTDLTVSFQLKSGVEIDGGYAGSTSATPDARDVGTYVTTLSGDIGTPGTATDNSYHVVNGSNTDSTAVLDGFTITAGFSGGTVPSDDAHGGGILILSGSPTLSHCVVSGNFAAVGGGMYNDHSSPTVIHCTFSGNSTTSGAGGVGNFYSSSPTIADCVFANNPGGVENFGSCAPVIVRCSFTGNTNGLSVHGSSSATVTDCIFSGNNGSSGGGGAYIYGASATFTGCTFTRNAEQASGSSAGGGLYCESATLSLTNCSFNGNSADSGAGVFSSQSSTTVTNCAFVGNTAASNGGAIVGSRDTSLAIVNCSFSSNTAPNDGAAIYTGNELNNAKATNCVIWGNSVLSGRQADGNLTVTYSDVEQGFAGTGNRNANPLFVRDPGAGTDGTWGTADDEYGNLQLQTCSPLADSGDNSAVPAAVTTDRAGGSRFADISTTADTGAGAAPVVDMGAYEAVPSLSVSAGGAYVEPQGQSITLDGHGASDVAGSLQYAWDFNGDGIFDDGTGPNPTFTSSAASGTVVVSVRLTDAASRTITASTTVMIVRPVLYVDASAPGPAHDGSSWSAAYLNPQAALAAAVPGQRIEVARGTYFPTTTTDRTVTFRLKNGVSIYGGYSGVQGADPNARDLAAYGTTFSGNIGSASSSTDNSYHVLTGNNLDPNMILDGIIVTAGNANGAGANQANGGGMINLSASPTVSRCTFTSNVATSGGGIYDDLASAPAVSDCTFVRNLATDGGGMSNVSSSSPMVARCLFDGNSASRNGGGFYYGTFGSYVVTDCIFVGNLGKNGAGIYNTSSSLTLDGSNFVSNAATTAGGAMQTSSSQKTTNCIMWGNTAGTSGPQVSPTSAAVSFSDEQGGFTGSGNINVDPKFYRNPSPGADGKWGTGGDDDYGDLRLLPGSPCIDTGSNALVPAGVTTDLAGGPRFFDFPGSRGGQCGDGRHGRVRADEGPRGRSPHGRAVGGAAERAVRLYGHERHRRLRRDTRSEGRRVADQVQRTLAHRRRPRSAGERLQRRRLEGRRD